MQTAQHQESLLAGYAIDSEILYHYKTLHHYIDEKLSKGLEQKLQKQAMQYRVIAVNHMKKFKNQVQTLRQLSDEQDKQLLTNNNIKYLTSENNFLKAQLLKSRTTIEALTHKNLHLKLIVEVYRQQSERQKNLFKKLIRQNFGLKEQLKNYSQEAKDVVSPCQKKNFCKTQNSQKSLLASPKQKFTDSLKNKRSNSLISNQKNKIRADYSLHFQNLKSQPINEQKSWQNRKLSESKSSLKQLSQKLNLSQWFMNCVLTVKKQVLRRKSLNNEFSLSTNEKYLSGNFDQIQDFLKTDKKRILQIFLSHEDLIKQIYQKLKTKENQTQTANLSQRFYFQSFRRPKHSKREQLEKQTKQSVEDKNIYHQKGKSPVIKQANKKKNQNNFLQILQQKHRINTKVKQHNRIFIKKKLPQQDEKTYQQQVSFN